MLDADVLALQAGQPGLDVVVGGGQGEVRGRVHVFRERRAGPAHPTAVFLQALHASQKTQLTAEERVHYSAPERETEKGTEREKNRMRNTCKIYREIEREKFEKEVERESAKGKKGEKQRERRE